MKFILYTHEICSNTLHYDSIFDEFRLLHSFGTHDVFSTEYFGSSVIGAKIGTKMGKIRCFYAQKFQKISFFINFARTIANQVHFEVFRGKTDKHGQSTIPNNFCARSIHRERDDQCIFRESL